MTAIMALTNPKTEIVSREHLDLLRCADSNLALRQIPEQPIQWERLSEASKWGARNLRLSRHAAGLPPDSRQGSNAKRRRQCIEHPPASRKKTCLGEVIIAKVRPADGHQEIG
jgi:hypothetical protein